MKKKICMIVPSFSARGGITTLVNGYKGSNLEEKYDLTYIETYCDGTKLKKLLKAIKGFVAFRNLIRNNRPDIVHIHSSFGASFYRKMIFIRYAASKKIPVINHVHGSEIEKLYTNSSNRTKRLIRSTFDKCSLIITLTEENRRKISVVNTRSKMVVLHNFSSIHFVEKDTQEKIVLFLGFITKLKGCFDIPEIAQKVAKKVPEVRFVLGGEGEIVPLKEKLKEYNIQDKILFPGWVTGEKKSSFIKQSTLFFLPSYTEAMPMSILEAMGYGLPIVSTNVGGIPQLVKPGENGYLYEPGDIDGMADGIIKILQDDELAKAMGACSYNMIKDKYSLEKHLTGLITIYNEMLS